MLERENQQNLTIPESFKSWVEKNFPFLPYEYWHSLYQTVNGIAHLIYELRKPMEGEESTEAQKNEDFRKAQEIALEAYKSNRNPHIVFIQTLNGRADKSLLNEATFFEEIFFKNSKNQSW